MAEAQGICPQEDPKGAVGLGSDAFRIARRHGRLAAGVLLCAFLLGLAYTLIMPAQYEAQGEVNLRSRPSLPQGAADAFASANLLNASLQQETLANLLRSGELGWQVIVRLKLYQNPAFVPPQARRLAGFHVEAPSNTTREWLIERFEHRLRIEIVPRTTLVTLRFRSRNAELSAAVVNELIKSYGILQSEQSRQLTTQNTDLLHLQLDSLKQKLDADELRLADFERTHGILSTPELGSGNDASETQHTAEFAAVDELGRRLAEATSQRLQREAEFHAASSGDPELLLSGSASRPEGTDAITTLLAQIHLRQSELEQEKAQLALEHGPNFPRMLEVRGLLSELEGQRKREDARLVARYRAAWLTSLEQESMARKSLEEHTAAAMQVNAATAQYVAMRQQLNATRGVYNDLLAKSASAEMLAGITGANLEVVDWARPPLHPVVPNTLLDLGVAIFIGCWLALVAVLLAEMLQKKKLIAAAVLLLLSMGAAGQIAAQAPTPNTSGLPTGVVRLPATPGSPSTQPNPRTSPQIWGSNPAGQSAPVALQSSAVTSAAPLVTLIGPGDFLEISEVRTPEFHSLLRVAADGSVELPMIHTIRLAGMNEQQAAHRIEAALMADGMLLHPQVMVMVPNSAGLDVSVLGEVVRPGVYPYTQHHRLLDVISAASGLSPTAGRLVNVFHRADAHTAHAYVLDPEGADSGGEHNPELEPGDTVQVSRAGLVYVVGDVLRPGGFPVDPVQGMTVVQLLTLAWGPTPNAALRQGVLIRELRGGRTITSLNLRRMLRGQDPDQPVHDRDILYVPDSAAKNLWNRTLESAIQSAVGVSIYSGLVYSQRY